MFGLKTEQHKPVLVTPLCKRSYLTLFPVDHACCPAGLATPMQTWSVPGSLAKQKWINYTNNALVLHYLLCFQTPYRCKSRLRVQRMLVTGVEGGKTFLPVLQVIHHLLPFAILDYIGPPFCNASDSNTSGFVCQLNAGRKV